MLSISLNPVPNQSVAFTADGAYWQAHIYQGASFMCADISINGTVVISGVRCFPGVALLPYSYMTAPDLGNLFFDSDVDWNGFGTTCNLYFLESDEVEQFETLLLTGMQEEGT